PQPAPQPQRPQPDPTMSAAAQPGVQFDNPIAEANQTWGSIVNSIKQANPGIDPRTLMRAAEMQLDNIKGIAPTTRAIMAGQIKAQQLGFEMQYKSARLQQLSDKLGIDLRNAKTKEDQVRLMDEYHRNLIALGEDRVAATERGQDTRLEGVRETNANRIDVEKLRGSNRVQLQGMRDTAAGQRAQAVLNGKRGPAMVAAIAKIRASGQEVTEDTINTLSTVFGDVGAGGQSAPAQAAPAPRAGGNSAPPKPAKYPNARLGRDPQGNPGWYIQQGGHTLKVG
ncbi:hypothetical protein, partial [Sphingomonas sp.]|uniref:hypothetical protein n=1 Tax=Sphingomonas sp. TaxID=28214 RepID=UPI00257B0D44